jgi:hypothetical protein
MSQAVLDNVIPDASALESHWTFPADVRGWLSYEEGLALSTLGRQKRVLEIGSYYGRSTITMAQHALAVTAVDWFRGDEYTGERGEGWTLPEFRANLERYGITEKVDVRVGRSEDVCPTLEPVYDVVFIDGGHDSAVAATDMQAALGCLRPEGGILALHDWQELGVQQAARLVLGWSCEDGQGVTVGRLHWRHVGRRPGVSASPVCAQSVFLAVPHNGQVSGEALPGLMWASGRGKLMVSPGKCSLLATNFNNLWVEALNKRREGNLTHFAMHHSDIQAPPYWLDTLLDEMDRVGADILSVVVCLKDDRGLTTTAVGSGTNSIRRLTLREIHQLPETFRVEDIPGQEPTRRLLVNTGLWVCRFTDKWVEPPTFPGFHLRDQIRWNAERQAYEAVCLSEDWGFSEWAHNHGLKVFATRKVAVTHYGVYGFSTEKPAGRWAIDLGDARKDELPVSENETESPPNSNGEPMSAKLYEQLGRKQEALETLDQAYTDLLGVLAGVVTGEIDRRRVLVNLTDRSWTVAPPGNSPSLPATINGLPVCKVAPPEEAPIERLRRAMLENEEYKANGVCAAACAD